MTAFFRKLNRLINDPCIRPYFSRILRPASYLNLARILSLAVTGYIYSVLDNRIGPFFQKKIISIKPFRLDPKMLESLPEYNMPKNASETSGSRIMLATKYAPLDKNVFSAKYDDNEDLFSANRFYWIFPLVLENNSVNVLERIKGMIFKWTEINDAGADARVFEPYSISERVISWITFLCLSGRVLEYKKDELKVLAASIEKQICLLLKNPEFHGSRTNNHILNNARAVYFCGLAFKNDHLKKTAQAILNKYFDKTVINGRVDEGSSHYQHLITMKFLELLKFASLMDEESAIKWLEPRIAMMLEQCRMMQSGYRAAEYPLFGDISPDTAPYWTNGRPFSGTESEDSPWYKIFRFVPGTSLKTGTSGYSTIVKTSSKDKHLEIWLSLKNNGIKCHGHNDNGSFVLFQDGEPIIIDPGLNSYINDSVSQGQTSQNSHSVPKIGQALWDAEKHSIFSNAGVSSSVKYANDDNGIEYDIKSFDSMIQLNRRIKCEKGGVTIIDKVIKDSFISGKYECVLPLAPGIVPRVTNNAVFLQDKKIRISANTDISIEEVISSTRYGEKKNAMAVRVRSGCQKEISLRIEREKNEK